MVISRYIVDKSWLSWISINSRIITTIEFGLNAVTSDDIKTMIKVF